MRKTGLPELLAPAGSFEALIAAIEAGADAVYVGGKSFGARAFAKNFDIEELERAAVYARLMGVKLYVTVNTLILDKESEELENYARALRKIAPDAIIAADLGVIKIFKEVAPEIEIHASTQMSIHNSLGADLAYDLGCKRVVLARELSLENIKATTEKCKPEVEVFLHGALCVSVSGQCLMSSLVGGRSGNRGECAQPCRLPYNSSYPLSLSDLSLATHVTELIDAGVASIKIEGRMKSPDYVYTVTKIYRRLLDEGRNANEKEIAMLRAAFSRGGFTDGYFTGKIFSKMTGVRSEDDKKESREIESHEYAPKKIRISAKAQFKLGEPSRLTLKLGEKSVSVFGDTPAIAERAPLCLEDLKSRLSKMGNTFFSLDAADIEIELDEGINLSPGAINALRRAAVAELEGGGKTLPETKLSKIEKTASFGGKFNTALFFNNEILLSLENKHPEKLNRFDAVFAPLMSEKYTKMTNGVYIPPVIHESELPLVLDKLKAASSFGIKYALIGNLSHIPLIKDTGLLPVGDFRLNVTNSYSKAALVAQGIKKLILSPEISLAMARDIGGGEIVLGKIPLMLTERCFMKENFSCAKCSCVTLCDRTGARFPMIREWQHRNIILNSIPTYMGDKDGELKRANIAHKHFLFTNESLAEAVKLIDAYFKAEPLREVRRIGSRGV